LTPNSVTGTHTSLGLLADVEVELVHRIVSDPGRLIEAWYGSIIEQGIKPEDYIEIAGLRSEIISELGKQAFVDVASTAAAFHGFVRVADSTGIPHSTAARGQDSSKLQREIGIDQFYAAELGDRG